MPSGRSALTPSLATSLAALSLSLTLAQPAQAAGLGRLSVLSALGQPLRAEVDVTSVSREEVASMTARLAPAEAFRLANVDYTPVLSTLRFSIATRPDGRSIVRITSSRPVDEPVVDLLVELNWAGGRLVRKYTFLLDPPEIKLEQRAIARGDEAVDVAAPVAVESDTRPVTAPRPRSAPARQAPAAVSAGPARTTAVSQAGPSSAATSAAADTVVVREGETIATVANRTKPAAIHIDQAIIALYRANPAAFFGSVHLLKAGATLTVPGEQTMASVDRIAARNEIRGISGGRESGRPAADPPSAAAPAAATAEQARAVGPSTRPPPPGTATVSAPPVASDAELLKVARARIVELERTVQALRKEVDEADLRIAELHRQLPQAAASPAPVTTGSPAAGTAAAGPASAATSPAAPSGHPAVATASPATEPTASSVPPPKPAPTPPSSPSPTPASAAANSSSSPLPASAPAASTASAPAAPQAEPIGGLTTLIDDLLAEPALPVGGAALLAALLAGLAYRARRRRAAATASKPADAGDEPPNSLFGTTAHDDFDPEVPTSTRDSDAAFHSTEIDPVSEAEVYVAYGRQSQAEEILRNALREHPARQPVRLRLMELLAARNDRAGFATLAGEMFDKAGGRNEEWPKVVTLGLMVDPDNPIYTRWTKSGDASGATAAAVNDTARPDSVPTDAGTSAAQGSATPPALPAAPENALDFVPPPLPDLTSASSTGRRAPEAPADTSNELIDLTELDIPLAFEPPPIEIPAPTESRPDADEPVPLATMRGEESELLVPPTLSFDAPETNIISPMSEGKRREQFDTALELALAYHELGDKEGVREMLRDVLENGSDAQKLKARQILAKAEGTSAQFSGQ